jgi:hypothetical protein
MSNTGNAYGQSSMKIDFTDLCAGSPLVLIFSPILSQTFPCKNNKNVKTLFFTAKCQDFFWKSKLFV